MPGKSIVLVGAGNIGTHAIRSVARIPEVERVTLIDRDTYEARNIVNQDILPQDVGEPKVLVQARKLAAICPGLKISTHHSPLESVPLGTWRSDLIVACLDSRAARQAVNERAWRFGVPWCDSGVFGAESLARVNVYLPSLDSPCIECAWCAEDYRMLEQQYPCAGVASTPAPSGAPYELGALAGAMLAIECRKMLAGELTRAAVGMQITFNARWHRFAATNFRRNARCRFDHGTWSIDPWLCDMAGMTIGELLSAVPAVQVPGQRFVRRLVCTECRHEKRLFHLAASLPPARRLCAHCRRPMVAPGFDIVETLDRNLPTNVKRQSLAQTGLRAGDVLRAGDRYFEIFVDSHDRKVKNEVSSKGCRQDRIA